MKLFSIKTIAPIHPCLCFFAFSVVVPMLLVHMYNIYLAGYYWYSIFSDVCYTASYCSHVRFDGILQIFMNCIRM